MAQYTGNPTLDGYVDKLFETSWANARDAATGDSADKTATTASLRAEEPAGGTFHVSRMFLVFSLSAIPATATITSATLALTASSVTGSGDSITAMVVESTQASTADLVTADFDQRGSTQLSDEVVMTNAQKTFTFNASGIAFLQSKIGLNAMLANIAKYDFNNTDPAVADGRWDIDTVDHGTAGNRPLLTINYIAPAGGNPMFFGPSLTIG